MDDHHSRTLDYQSTHTQAIKGKPSKVPVIAGSVHLLLLLGIVVGFRHSFGPGVDVIRFVSLVFLIFTIPVFFVWELVLFIIRPRVSLYLLILGHGACVLYTIWIYVNWPR